jgi:cell division control protein 6
MDMLGLITVYERNEGISAGRYHEYELEVSLAAVIDVLKRSDRFEDIAHILQSAAEDTRGVQTGVSEFES